MEEALDIAYKQTVEDADGFIKLLMEKQGNKNTELEQEQYV
ncbi:MAG: hypothetical protein CDV28_1383 [Candidatus Electronema aureum]|uniref:Uncharacterized protein n=1 Tax=Candidatus Electronema aureum TaxID=2005002 RepID=A0A521FZD8_9BACT|nr:MAG: hypothetical protein CDV28_1383 [Candidatus Electronema aureum]